MRDGISSVEQALRDRRKKARDAAKPKPEAKPEAEAKPETESAPEAESTPEAEAGTRRRFS